jgi:hypothetical protein
LRHPRAARCRTVVIIVIRSPAPSAAVVIVIIIIIVFVIVIRPGRACRTVGLERRLRRHHKPTGQQHNRQKARQVTHVGHPGSSCGSIASWQTHGGQVYSMP